MENNLTYNEAYLKLQELVEQLEDGNIQLDELAEKVKQANELIAICDTKLRDIDKDVNDSINSSSE